MVADDLRNALYRYRWYVFATLLCCYFFVYFHRMTVGILGTEIVEDVGGTVGVLSSAYFWTYTLMQIPSGILADRLGPRVSSAVFMTIAAVGSLLTAFGDSFGVVVAGKILIAAGMAVVYIPLMKLVAVWFGKRDFPQLNGIVIAVGNVGALAASAPLEMLAGYLGGWRPTFMFLGFVTVVLALLCFLVIRDHPSHIGLPSVEDVEGLPRDDATDAKMPVREGLKVVFSSGRRFWTLALAYFLVYGSIMVFQGTWAKTYFSNVYDFTLSVAWFVTLIGIGKILSTVLIGRLTSSGVIRSKRSAMVVGTLLFTIVWAVLWLLAGKVDSYWFWAVVSFLFGFFGGFMTLSFTQVKEWFPIAIAGTSVSAMNTFLFLGSSVFTTVAGYVIGTTYSVGNFSTVWGMMTVASLLAFVLVLLSVERSREEVSKS